MLRPLGFAVLASVLAMGIGLCTWAQAPADQLSEITASLRARQFDQALHFLDPALKANPKNAQLWTLRGIALSGKGDKNAASIAFHHALELSPDYLPALEGAAQIEYDRGGKDVPVLLQRILRLRPQDPTSHAMLAVIAARRGDCAGAVPHFEQSGSLIDSQPGALQQYGACLIQLKQPDKAVAVFQRVLAQSNDDKNARCRLASVEIMARRPQDAIETLQPLLHANSSDPEVVELAASAYEKLGDTPEAVRLLREAIVANPHNVNLYLDFANLSLDHQSYQVGVDMMSAGIEAEPQAAALYVARGILYVQFAQYEKAEADFAKADALDPKQSIGSAAAGLAAVQKNDPDAALATVRAKLRKNPDDPFLLYLQAQILTDSGPQPGSHEFQLAMDSAKRAISLRPSLAASHDVLAKLYFQAGNNDAAIAHSRKALASNPKDQTALYHLIQALRKSGKKEELPHLLKQLADLRIESTKEEAEHNRYKLVEARPSVEPLQP